MKRSASIRLLLMGAATFTLAACGDDDEEPQPIGVYSSIEECVGGGIYTEQFCRDNFEVAARRHATVAPKYSRQEDCEADFGPSRCQFRPVATGESGSSVWMPAMMGFMLGNMLANRNQPAEPLYRPITGCRDQYGTPAPCPASPTGLSGGSVFSYVTGSWRTADNVEVAQRTGTSQVRPSSIPPSSTRTTTISRGGFGARAASVGTASS